ncbi:MAG: hypothetical protein LBT46_07230 [Planctomycetaceae bacterium]|jgi:hypothetical protein|nr:hypothetical protein [Planctomycetaceae bacterium]
MGNAANGFEKVRDYVIFRCREAAGNIVCFTNQEAADAAGISKMSASRHIRLLIELKVIIRVRRSVYHFVPLCTASEHKTADSALLRNGTNCSKQVQSDTNCSKMVQTDTKSAEYKEEEREEEKEKTLKEVVYSFGVTIGGGILQQGFPVRADDIDRFVDWENPNVRRAEEGIKAVMPTSSAGWSPILTKRLVFGVLYCLDGFDSETLKGKAADARTRFLLYRDMERAKELNIHFLWKKNEGDKYQYKIVGTHVRFWFDKAGIEWVPVPANSYQRIKERSQTKRERIRDSVR